MQNGVTFAVESEAGFLEGHENRRGLQETWFPRPPFGIGEATAFFTPGIVNRRADGSVTDEIPEPVVWSFDPSNLEL